MAMTQDRQTQYERALMRAHKAGLRVVGRGTVKATGERFYAVNSASEADRWHVVIVRGGSLVCDCIGAQHARYCQHRAIVRREMEREAANRAALESAIRAGMADAERRAAERRRESAVLLTGRGDNKGFSIWKS